MPTDTAKHPAADARPGYSAGRRTRTDIVNAACDVIAEQGYGALTVSSLADRAGISKGGLYHHFERVTDVVVAAYEATAQSIMGGLKMGRPADFDEYLSEVEYVVFERLLKDPKALRIVTELYPRLMFDPSFREARKASFNNVIDVMSGVLTDSFRSKIDQDELRNAIKSASVFLIGLVVQHGANQDLEQSREQWQWFKATVSARLSGDSRVASNEEKI